MLYKHTASSQEDFLNQMPMLPPSAITPTSSPEISPSDKPPKPAEAEDLLIKVPKQEKPGPKCQQDITHAEGPCQPAFQNCPFKLLEPSERWATADAEAPTPTWAFVLARAVYLLLTPGEWRGAVQHHVDLVRCREKLQLEWRRKLDGDKDGNKDGEDDKKADEKPAPEPVCEESVFMRRVYEHARGVLGPLPPTARPTLRIAGVLCDRRYSERSMENTEAVYLVQYMWRTCKEKYVLRKEEEAYWL